VACVALVATLPPRSILAGIAVYIVGISYRLVRRHARRQP
jgi:hypothetical protein